MFSIEGLSMEVNGTSFAISILLMYLSFFALKILSIHRMAKEMYDAWKKKEFASEVASHMQEHERDN